MIKFLSIFIQSCQTSAQRKSLSHLFFSASFRFISEQIRYLSLQHICLTTQDYSFMYSQLPGLPMGRMGGPASPPPQKKKKLYGYKEKANLLTTYSCQKITEKKRILPEIYQQLCSSPAYWLNLEKQRAEFSVGCRMPFFLLQYILIQQQES